MADLPLAEVASVTVESADGGTKLLINSDGSLNARTLDGSGNSIGSTSSKLNVYDSVVDNDLSTINTNLTNGDLRGTVNAIPLDGTKLTYSAAAVGIATAATPTDVVTINGSSTKIIRVLRVAITLSTTAGSGIGDNLQLVKRSSANSGGTSSTLAMVPHDSINSAATASCKSYTANPTTLGTLVGVVRSIRYAATTSGTANQEIIWDFGIRPGQALVLRGVAEGLSINLNSTTITGGALDASFEWTEE